MSDRRTERPRGRALRGRQMFKVGGFIDMNRNDARASAAECQWTHANRPRPLKPAPGKASFCRRLPKVFSGGAKASSPPYTPSVGRLHVSGRRQSCRRGYQSFLRSRLGHLPDFRRKEASFRTGCFQMHPAINSKDRPASVSPFQGRLTTIVAPRATSVITQLTEVRPVLYEIVERTR